MQRRRRTWLFCIAGGLTGAVCSAPARAQSGVTMTVPDPSGTTLLGDYAYASKSNRTVQAGGWTLDQRLTGRLFGWIGQQSVLATGKKSADRFSAGTDRFGARMLLSRSEWRGWTLGYDGYRPHGGRFVGPNNSLARPGEITSVHYPDTQTDLLNLRYTFGRALTANAVDTSDSVSRSSAGDTAFRVDNGVESLSRVPTFNVRAGLQHVQAVGNGVNAITLGGGALFNLRRDLSADIEVTGFGEQMTGGRLSTLFKSHVYAGVVYHPFRWVRLVFSAEIMPSGVPFAGTSLSGFSSYMLYDPGGVLQSMQNGPVADLNVQLQVSRHF